MTGVATALLVLLVGIGIPIAAALFYLGVMLGELYAFLPPLPSLGDITWSTSTEFLFVSIPLFILMGEVLLRAGLAEEMYRALAPGLSRVPGGLMHTNIASCALFAATSGSSVATAATIGTIAMPNMDRFGYSRPLFLGSLAAGGTLGILIPPSINMIIYGVLADVSVGDLYLAGLLPGLLMAGLFMGLVWMICVLRPASGGHGGDHVRVAARLARRGDGGGAVLPRRGLDLCRARHADRSGGARRDSAPSRSPRRAGGCASRC